MDKVQKILENNSFQETLAQINDLEKNRIYCKHDLSHALDVARIAYIINIEEGAGIAKHCIYAAALLHDIGRAQEYLDGTPHNIAAQAPATEILMDAGYSEEEINAILSAISNHRDKKDNNINDSTFQVILYKADKLSRPCMSCEASDSCNWDEDKKNNVIKY